MDFLKENKKDLVLWGVSCGIAAVLLVVGALPKKRQLRLASDDVRQLESQILGSSDALKELEDVLLEGPLTKDFAADRERNLLPALLEMLADLGEQHDLEIVSMTPRRVKRTTIEKEEPFALKGESEQLSIHISALATYRDIAEYFAALEMLPALVTVRDLHIKRSSTTTKRLRVDFRIDTFSITTHET